MLDAFGELSFVNFARLLLHYLVSVAAQRPVRAGVRLAAHFSKFASALRASAARAASASLGSSRSP
ncbi:MAG: hypothetical protein M3N47_02590, partial [Chloroflexota bacterium]|nr:hypothetical protein [Chloroflexota bacterium]